ncbi:MAG: hypothetical protein OEZ47_15685, partial [Gammaproteobacteria bacterium]|nr:hypothetical protein [Gammaproteobacteria bacterium]
KGLKIDGYEHDVERFGWYAVAMNSLGIPSKMPENPNWHKVKNPSKILKKHDMILVKARNLIKQHYSIDIQI